MFYVNQEPRLETSLDKMNKGSKGTIVRFTGPEPTIRRLMEMGMLEESLVEVVYEAPFGGDPIAVRVRGALLALRRKEAQCIWVRGVIHT